MTKQTVEAQQYPKTILLGIEAPYNKTKDIEAYFEEFKNLAHANGVVFEELITMKLREIDSANFITKGKLDEIRDICQKNNIEQLIISEALTSKQERNLSDYFDCEVYDRTQLILEIFEKSAHTGEGKAQVEIAMLQHLKARIAGKGIFLSQQIGIIGTKGPGETAKEKALRHIDLHIVKLTHRLDKMHQARVTQRKQRLSSHIPQIALVGYTNAGKSTILNALTKSNVLAENKLFSTLDTTTRELYVDGKKVALISDTVGFIQQLPHHLIEAFKSTLSELQYADLLLQVVDVSDKNWESQIKVVHEILLDLDVKASMLYVFNKTDKLENIEDIQFILDKYQPNVIVSAISKDGIKPLVDYLSANL